MIESDLFIVQNLNDKIFDAQDKLQLLQVLSTSLKSPADNSSAHSPPSYRQSPFENISTQVIEQQHLIDEMQEQAFQASVLLVKQIESCNLPRHFKNALIYFFALDKSVEEIAKIMSYSTNSIYRFINQAKKILFHS